MNRRDRRHHESYLGDGAYVYADDLGCVVLYTSDGAEETNRVVLEPEVLAFFEHWLKRARHEDSSPVPAR